MLPWQQLLPNTPQNLISSRSSWGKHPLKIWWKSVQGFRPCNIYKVYARRRRPDGAGDNYNPRIYGLALKYISLMKIKNITLVLGTRTTLLSSFMMYFPMMVTYRFSQIYFLSSIFPQKVCRGTEVQPSPSTSSTRGKACFSELRPRSSCKVSWVKLFI